MLPVQGSAGTSLPFLVTLWNPGTCTCVVPIVQNGWHYRCSHSLQWRSISFSFHSLQWRHPGTQQILASPLPDAGCGPGQFVES
jgi:hypothetical protein